MSADADLVSFASREAMAARVADVIEAQLGRALAERGRGALAVSGGSTPAALYGVLSGRKLDWARVSTPLVDERWVPPGADGSNETFVRSTLQQGAAAEAEVIGLWSDAATPGTGAAVAAERLETLQGAPDVVVLGMGSDGHTASWFPRAQGLDDALSEESGVAYVKARQSDVTGEHLDRLTMTLGAVMTARFVCLLITGDEKRAVLEKAAASGPVEDMPVRAILRARPDLWVCWAP